MSQYRLCSLDVYARFSASIVCGLCTFQKEVLSPSRSLFGFAKVSWMIAFGFQVSVPSNIAEGMSRVSDKEKNHFLEISTGSLMETMCQIEIAKRLGYVSKEDFRVEKEIYEIACMLSSLRKKITQTNSLTH
jgi:hypothetical protein